MRSAGSSGGRTPTATNSNMLDLSDLVTQIGTWNSTRDEYTFYIEGKGFGKGFIQSKKLSDNIFGNRNSSHNLICLKTGLNG